MDEIDNTLYFQPDGKIKTGSSSRMSLDITMKNKEKIYPNMIFEYDNIIYKLTTLNDVVFTESHNRGDDFDGDGKTTIYSQSVGVNSQKIMESTRHDIKKWKLFGR